MERKNRRLPSGQSMLAVVAALGAAMVVTAGVLQSTKYFSRSMKSTEEGVRFNNWASTVLQILQGGLNKGPGGNFACTGAFDGVILREGQTKVLDSSAPLRWPAYCTGNASAKPQANSSACTSDGGTWTAPVYLQKDGVRQGVKIEQLQIVMPGSPTADLGGGNKVYRAQLQMRAQKVDTSGAGNRLNWAQYFFVTVRDTGGGNYAVSDCTVGTATPTPTPQPNPLASQTSATPTPAPDGCLSLGGYVNLASAPYYKSWHHLYDGSSDTRRVRIPAGTPQVNFMAIGHGGMGYEVNTNGPSPYGGGGGGAGAYQSGGFRMTDASRAYCLEINYRWNGSDNANNPNPNSYVSIDYVFGPQSYQRYTLANVNNGSPASASTGGVGGVPNPNYCSNNLFGDIVGCVSIPGERGGFGTGVCGGGGGVLTGASNPPGGPACSGVATGGGVPGNVACNWTANGVNGNNCGGGGGGGGYYAGQPNYGAEGGPAQVSIWW